MAAELKLIAAAIGPPGASPDWAAVVEQRNSKAESEPAAIALLQTIWQQVAPQLAELVAAMGIRQGRREDVLQDVWLTAFQKFPADCDADGLRRWLVRVAVNRCHLEQRRAGRWRAVWQSLAERFSGRAELAISPEADASDVRRLVRQALKRLEPEMRSLLILRYFLEFDSTEIGRILDMPDSTVRGRLREARRRLAGELKRAGFDYDR